MTFPELDLGLNSSNILELCINIPNHYILFHLLEAGISISKLNKKQIEYIYNYDIKYKKILDIPEEDRQLVRLCSLCV